MTTTMETSGSLFGGGGGVRECNKVVKSFFFSSFSSRASSSSSRIRCRRVFFLVVFAASFLFLLHFFYREKGEGVGTFNENVFSFNDERTTTPSVEYLSEMIDGNEDELEGGGRTAFEMMKQTTKEDDDEDAFNDDEEKMISTSQGEQLLSSSCASSEEEEHGAGFITKATRTRQAWAFKASSSLQYAHMPTHATHGSMVLLAFQGAKRSEGQANQRIYLVRSEDGGKTFDSSNAKKLNALVVEGGRSSFSGEKEDAKVEAQWGPALFKEEEEESVGAEKDNNKKKIPLLRLYYSQSESCFFCRHRNTCGSDAKEYRAGGNLYETTSKDFGKTWSKPKLILKEKEKDPTKGGNSPKVVASPPIRTKLGGAEKNATSASSHLLLPYWTQKPRVGANGIKSACASEMNAKDGPRTLHSKDNGKSWHPLGTRAVRHEDAHRKAPEIDRLLEGAIVSSNSKIVQFFRATRPRVYASLFDEKKTEWGKPFPVRASTPSKHHNHQHHHHHHRDDFLKMPNAKLHAISIPHQTQILLAHNDHPYRVRQRGNLVVQISDGVNPDGNGLAPFRKILDVETARGRKEGEMVTYPHMEIVVVASPCPRRRRSSNNYELTLSYSDHGRGIRFVRAKLE